MSTDAGLMPDERHRMILDRLAGAGRVLATDLAHELGASEDTIRRDLRELAAAGLCQRVYGGALALRPTSPASGSLKQRRGEAPERKTALAAAAAGLVGAASTVFIDAGSTNEAIACAIPPSPGLTVVTNAPAIAAHLAERGGLDVILVGGRIDPRSGAALGARALRDVERIRVDLFFLGGCAIDAELGVGAFDAEEAEFKRAVAVGAVRIVTAITSDKLGTRAPFAVMAAADLGDVVVEHDAPEDRIAQLAAAGPRIHRAAPAGRRA